MNFSGRSAPDKCIDRRFHHCVNFHSPVSGCKQPGSKARQFELNLSVCHVPAYREADQVFGRLSPIHSKLCGGHSLSVARRHERLRLQPAICRFELLWNGLAADHPKVATLKTSYCNAHSDNVVRIGFYSGSGQISWLRLSSSGISTCLSRQGKLTSLSHPQRCAIECSLTLRLVALRECSNTYGALFSVGFWAGCLALMRRVDGFLSARAYEHPARNCFISVSKYVLLRVEGF